MTEGLTTIEINELKNRLLQRLNELKENNQARLNNSDVEDVVNLSGKVHDRGEEAAAEVTASLNYNLNDIQIRELHAVESALERLNSGQYGLCVDCDEEIPYSRLLAEPEALRCIDCQQIYEKQNN